MQQCSGSDAAITASCHVPAPATRSARKRSDRCTGCAGVIPRQRLDRRAQAAPAGSRPASAGCDPPPPAARLHPKPHSPTAAARPAHSGSPPGADWPRPGASLRPPAAPHPMPHSRRQRLVRCAPTGRRVLDRRRRIHGCASPAHSPHAGRPAGRLHPPAPAASSHPEPHSPTAAAQPARSARRRRGQPRGRLLLQHRLVCAIRAAFSQGSGSTGALRLADGAAGHGTHRLIFSCR